MSAQRWVTFVLAAIVMTGCTRVVVNKNPGERDRGIRYYRPKPYLFITPGTTSSSETEAALTTTCKTIQNRDLKMQLNDAQAKGIVRPEATPVDYQVSSEELPLAPIPAGMERTTLAKAADDPPPGAKVSITMMYMPDFAEEYSIRLMPGLGIGELSLKLDDGWNLTSVGMKTDQQTDEIIKTTADLIGALGGLRGGAPGSDLTPTPDTRSSGLELLATNIPFGFYEAVIAEDCYGRKQLYGWRYIGFMPFQSCPVQPNGLQQATCHDPCVIYGMVIDQCGVLRFEPLARIPSLDPGPSTSCEVAEKPVSANTSPGPHERPSILTSFSRKLPQRPRHVLKR